MGTLADQIASTLLPGMRLPEPLAALFEWIEASRLYIDRPSGERIGFLYPQDALRAGRTDAERPGGTEIEFFAEGNVNMKYWFRHERSDMLERLCVFARTGADGSMAAFWLDPRGGQKIVHLGSGSGSTMTCVLADDAVDFLRLLAIGYDEICWKEDLGAPPAARAAADGFTVHPNAPFRQWVASTFGVAIPRTGSEIVRHPAELGDIDSPDPFNRWVAEQTADRA